MGDKIPPPLFTLRGHDVGVTSLTYCHNSDEQSYLISGDEGGNIIVWDLFTFKRLLTFSMVAKSRIQSLRTVKVSDESTKQSILVVQFRDHGLQLLDLSRTILSNPPNANPKIIAFYPTSESIFSRGDALSIVNNGRALLVYPSCLENYLVTVRLIGINGVTETSGTASRGDDKKNPTIFDIIVKENIEGGYLLFVAYEDGYICVFGFDLNLTKSVPSLNSTGMKIDLIRKIDSNIGDFVSAFDVIICDHDKENKFIAVCGSPIKKLVVLTSPLNSLTDSEPIQEEVALKRQGVSALTIRPDKKLVAVAGWDSKVRIYSMKSRKLLVSLDYHLKQVQDILFIEKRLYSAKNHLLEGGAEMELQDTKEGKHLMCCASMEGTISLSSIY